MRFKRHDESIGMGAWVFALVAMLLGLGALGVAGQALTRSDDAKSIASASNGTQVTLHEFAIDPSMIAVDTGGSLTVKNTGTVAHNLAIKNTSLKTADIAPGKSESLDLSSLKTGHVHGVLPDPGARGRGDDGDAARGTRGRHRGGRELGGDEGPERPAGRGDEGAGGRVHEAAHRRPEHEGRRRAGAGAEGARRRHQGVRPHRRGHRLGGVAGQDGAGAGPTTAPCRDPTIKVDPGDHVRVVLDNKLPQSTAIHFHGITVPNAMDGVPDVTQPPVKPGETFTYDFVASQNARGRDVPLAPPRRAPGARRAARRVHHRRRAGARRRDRVTRGPDGAQRRRRDRPDAQREVVPRHCSGHREAGRLGRGPLHERGPADPPDAPARAARSS